MTDAGAVIARVAGGELTVIARVRAALVPQAFSAVTESVPDVAVAEKFNVTLLPLPMGDGAGMGDPVLPL
jgi:hypothetical protein